MKEKDLKIQELLLEIQEKDELIHEYALAGLVRDLEVAGFRGFSTMRDKDGDGFGIHFGTNYQYIGIKGEEYDDEDESD